MVVIAAVRDQKAVGSNPTTSTKKPWKIHDFFFLLFGIMLDYLRLL